MRLDISDSNKKCRSGHYLFCVTLLLLGCSLYFLDFGTECFFVSHPSPGHRHLPLTTTPEHATIPEVPAPARNDCSGFVVDTPGCRIPALDPFDPLVKRFIEKVKTIECTSSYPHQLVESNLTALYVVRAALSAYNVSEVEQLDCCYRPFWRVEGNVHKYSYGVDDKIQYSKNCTFFQNEVRLDNEFVKVECQINGTEVYTDYYAFTPLKDDVEQRCEQEANNLNSVFDDDALSVFIIGIDAVSRLNFHRQMPRTERFLREMGAFEMLGYNKVADNTFPNLIPVLTGLTEEELQKTCWKNNRVAFDNCTWLWNNYSDAGYRTAFGEDAPWMGIFSYLKVGFVRQPTDYYMRPYSKTYEDVAGHTKRMNAKLCIGPRLTIEILLQYASKFARTMASKRSFSLFWGASLSHDFLNYPQLGDALHESMLRELFVLGALNRTLLIVMSDHGIRWGSIRETYQGRMEERLPLLFFMLPSWFRNKYGEAVANLRRNAHRLTTPFDLHATLVDLLHVPGLEKTSLRMRTYDQSLSPPPRGSSLFLPVSKNRTCAEAGILPHWCTCQQSQPLVLDSTVVKKMALFLVEYLNHLLKPYRACSQLSLHSVHDARLQVPHEHLSQNKKNNDLQDYVLVIQTTPGGGLFEATVRDRLANKVSVAGTVSRINPYGNQSSCVTEYHMKLYCYCDPFPRLKLLP